MDLVLYHHNHTKSNYPDLCSILKKADHHSASEREDIDDTQEVNKTPLISLFSKIVLEGNDKVDEQYIPLNKLSLDDGSFNNLKPAAKKDTMGGWNLVPEYNRLWDEFNFEFELIQNKTDFNTLLALLKKYASTMPSAAYKSKSDISLYDHSKTTAALAVSRYLFNRDGDVKLTQKDDLNCYLAIEGDISGIQKFIFKISSPQEAQSGMSKRLRGRSLYLTLLCDAIATHIAEALEIAEITDFEELLKDKDFENEYKTEYYENRVDRLIKSLKTMSFDKALKRSGISENDYNRWYAAGKKQCLLKKDEDEFCLNFYINVTRVLMNRYLKLRSEGKTKTEACKKINTDLNEVKRWCNWNESGLFIDFKENNKKITAKLIIDAIKDGKSKDKIAESSDITLHELNKIIDLGLQNDRICREVYEEYESVYLSKHLEVFLKEIKNKNLKKALKTSGIEKSELDSAYNSGKNGDERFTKFYNDYLNFKISCYITQIIRGKTVSKALKNSNLTDEELKDNLKEIESRILDKQMNSVIGEIAKNRTTRQAAKKARIRIDEIYRWYLEGKKGNEKFKDFADIYHELYVEVGCEIFQNFLNKGKTPKQILKIMNEDITREDYEFWIKNNLISDKNVEAKLYTEDEIKEKIENEGFRQKEEKSLSGLSIIGC